jgi:arylsulfatase A-like enzyme
VAGPPNILFITVDQFRGDCLSALGHQVVHTPNLDRLAARGVLLTRHYSQAAPCGPGRACLYTGTYQMNNRVVFNGTPLDDRLDNIARSAQRAGYRPTLFGYTDQAADPRTISDPDDPRLGTYEGVLPGFDVALDLTGARSAWTRWVAGHGHPTYDDPDRMLATEPDRPAELGISAFLTGEFLDWVQQRQQPWFAHLSHLRPHPPYAAAGHWATAYQPDDVDMPIDPGPQRHAMHDLMLGMPGLAAPTDEATMRQLRAQYYGMIGDVDEQIGRTMDGLASLGLADDTVVVVTADHGELLGDHGLIGKMGWHEESYRIPAMVCDPRRPDGHGTVVDIPTENVDLFPTLCDVMGVEIPEQCDGVSLDPFLDGMATPAATDAAASWRTAVAWEFDWRALLLLEGHVPQAGDRSLETMNLAVRLSSDTAYVQFGDGSWQCLDVAADPTWRTPVSDPGAVLAAAQDMLTWRSRNLDRTMTGTLLEGTMLGRRPPAATWR